jgi:SulP family sulfate permease
MSVTLQNPPPSKSRVSLFRGILPINRSGVMRDMLAGFTLAAMNVPQALGYTRIAGMPVVTGLYTLLLPLIAFATFGSSRYLVVAADSATAAILAGSLSIMAPIASEHYVALAGMVALLTAGCLLLARLFKLGFLADFLSQTVLVGFLTGVGFQVGIAMLGDMLGVHIASRRTVVQLAQVLRGLPQTHVPTLCLAAATVTIILLIRNLAPRIPGSLFVVVGSIAASAAYGFAGHGIKLIEGVTGGLPSIGLPNVTLREIPSLLPVAGSCFLMIVAQSSATAYAYASRHRQTLDIDTDLVGLAAANAAAALSGTFVVNGSPTQTAMVESSGGRSQVAHLTTTVIVGFVLLFLTGPLSATLRTRCDCLHDRYQARRPARPVRHSARNPWRVRAGVDHRSGGRRDRRRTGHYPGDGVVVAPSCSPQLSTLYCRIDRRRRLLAADSRGPGHYQRARPDNIPIRRRPFLRQR